MKLHRIVKVEPQSGFMLRLQYDDGVEVQVGFQPLIRRGGVYARLGDGDFFHRVRIGEHGRCVHWPDDLDFCADALRLRGKARKSRSSVKKKTDSAPKPKRKTTRARKASSEPRERK